MKIPHEIEVNVEDFNDKTTDGQNEKELVDKFTSMVNQQEQKALAQCVLTGFEQFCKWGGIIIGGIGLIMLLAGTIFLGMIINWNSKRKAVEANRQNISAQFEKKRKNGAQVIRALLAEVVDFRAEFAEKDNESQKVVDFLEQISPDQYVRKLADSNRRIRVSN